MILDSPPPPLLMVIITCLMFKYKQHVFSFVDQKLKFSSENHFFCSFDFLPPAAIKPWGGKGKIDNRR